MHVKKSALEKTVYKWVPNSLRLWYNKNGLL